MPGDALDPGPDGFYPWFPRLSGGSPAWADVVPTGYSGPVVRRGVEWLTSPSGRRIGFDVTPRDAAGDPIVIPIRQA